MEKAPRLALTLVGAAAVLLLLRYTREVLIPFAVAGLLFHALDPVVDWLQRRRIPRAIGALLAVLLLVGAGGGLAYSLQDDALATIRELPKGARQLSALLQRPRNSPALAPVEAVQRAADELQNTGDAQRPGAVRVQVEEPRFRAGEYLLARSGSALAAVNQGVMLLFLTYFMLLSDQLFKRKLVELGATLSTKKITVKILEDIATQIERFFVVQILTSVGVGLATWLALWSLGLHQAALWGFLAGVLNSIPYYGPLLVSGGLALVAFLQFGNLTMPAVVSSVALVITTLEGSVLTPALLGKVAQMNHVTIFGGLLFWSWAWGLWGLLLAVPMMMVIKAICDGVDELQPIGRFMGD